MYLSVDNNAFGVKSLSSYLVQIFIKIKKLFLGILKCRCIWKFDPGIHFNTVAPSQSLKTKYRLIFRIYLIQYIQVCQIENFDRNFF